MPRLFTALEIPEEMGLTLSHAARRTAGRDLDRPRRTTTSPYTLVSARSTSASPRPGRRRARPSRIRRRTFDVVIRGIDYFGGAKPHSVYARVVPTPALMELQAEHERILQRMGGNPEGRKFTPHVTIAQVKGAAARDVAQWLDVRGGFSADGWKRTVRAVLVQGVARGRALCRQRRNAIPSTIVPGAGAARCRRAGQDVSGSRRPRLRFAGRGLQAAAGAPDISLQPRRGRWHRREAMRFGDRTIDPDILGPEAEREARVRAGFWSVVRRAASGIPFWSGPRRRLYCRAGSGDAAARPADAARRPRLFGSSRRTSSRISCRCSASPTTSPC